VDDYDFWVTVYSCAILWENLFLLYFHLIFGGNWKEEITVFSSPELKAQVNFSDRPLSDWKFLHFQLLLMNHRANFNQTWHKSSLVGEDSKLFKWRAQCPCPRGDDSKWVKIQWQIFKNLQNQQVNFNQTWYKSSLSKGKFKIFQIKGQVLFKGEINAKMGWSHLKIFLRTTEPEELKFTWKLSDIM
jgi:hypothetical protein